MLALLGACFALSLYGVNGGMVGPIIIKENGQDVTRYVVSTYPPLARVEGTSIILQHDAQVQIAQYPQNNSVNYTADSFVEYKLMGKTISFTANISSVSCSCNAAFYLAGMPGIGSNGQPNPGKATDYYCDANDGNSEWCWELDIMEANKYVTAATPHKCDQSPGTYVQNCDRGGCQTNAHNVNGNGMCPGSNCQIDTRQPFRYSMQFNSGNYHLSMTQGSQTFAFDVCNNGGYLSSMNQALEYGMTLVLSYWGGTYDEMDWLDKMTGCTGDCQTNGLAIFSDIEIS